MKLAQEEREGGSQSPIWQQLIPTATLAGPDNDVHIDVNEEKAPLDADPLRNESNRRWCQFSRSPEQAANKNHQQAETALPSLGSTVKSPLATYSLIK